MAHNPYSADYTITKPNGVTLSRPEGKYWAFSLDSFEQKVADKEVVWGEGDSYPMIMRFLSEVQDGLVPITIFDRNFAGDTLLAKKQVDSILGVGKFEYPKPTLLIERVIELAAGPEATILDSFAGSGTTAHAVLAANKRDGGNRRFILVEQEDYADTLTAERVRRVIDGYPYTGTQKEELLREKLTWSKLKKADALVDEVGRLEEAHGRRFDKVATTVKNGELIVTGERTIKERAPELGGSFTYCTLGEPVDMEAILSGDALPTVEALAGLLWHTATAQNFDPAALSPAPSVGADVYRLGDLAGRTYWLFYRSELDWLRSADAALSLARARAIAEAGGREGDHLVFAPAKFVGRTLLAKEGLPVEYAPLPNALYRLEAI